MRSFVGFVMLWLMAPNSALSAKDISLGQLVRATDMARADLSSVSTVDIVPDTKAGGFRLVFLGHEKKERTISRALVFKLTGSQIALEWDSKAIFSQPAFERTGDVPIVLRSIDGETWLTIEGCARHACSDGLSGFFAYHINTGNRQSAIVTAEYDGVRKLSGYRVAFSGGTELLLDEVDGELTSLICGSSTISQPSRIGNLCSRDARRHD